MTIARHLTIAGRVQRVFYRNWAVGTARQLGLAGWVRNREDGTVEAIVQGDEFAVKRFVELAKDGPPGARVDRIETSDMELDAGLDEFRQKPTMQGSAEALSPGT